MVSKVIHTTQEDPVSFPALLFVFRHGDDVPLRHLQRRGVAVRVAGVLKQDLVVVGRFKMKYRMTID